MANGARLNGQQKAACLMLALNEEQAAALFAKMDDEEIGELSLGDGQSRHHELGDDRGVSVIKTFGTSGPVS